MNKKEFYDMAERLRKEIDYAISYVYGAFLSTEDDSVLAKMKSNIYVADRAFVDRSLLEKGGKEVIFPYDVLRHKVTKCIEDFYCVIYIQYRTSVWLRYFSTVIRFSMP